MVISIPTALPLAKQPEARFPVHPTTTRPAYGNPLPAWGVVEVIGIKMDEKSQDRGSRIGRAAPSVATPNVEGA